jgi:hypothetical protein
MLSGRYKILRKICCVIAPLLLNIFSENDFAPKSTIPGKKFDFLLKNVKI